MTVDLRCFGSFDLEIFGILPFLSLRPSAPTLIQNINIKDHLTKQNLTSCDELISRFSLNHTLMVIKQQLYFKHSEQTGNIHY